MMLGNARGQEESAFIRVASHTPRQMMMGFFSLALPGSET